MTTMMESKPLIEDISSWTTHIHRTYYGRRRVLPIPNLRRLNHHHHHHKHGHRHHHHEHHDDYDDDDHDDQVHNSTEEDHSISLNTTTDEGGNNNNKYNNNNNNNNTSAYNYKMDNKFVKKHNKHVLKLWADPGIGISTVHGMMIDAGSTGSRLHLYEWEPRVLRTDADVQAAVSGRKLSYPGTESRWTVPLRPGLATFATILDNEQLMLAVTEYLSPLIEFAKAILHQKESMYGRFPIFLRATAGMRILLPQDRARLLNAVRTLFANKTFCPFYFEDKHARVLSGEEEAIFDWTGVNFLLGNLLEQSEGSGVVINPQVTYGALDLGGASTQISFIQKDDDIMSNLFKLQIGQGKHWNVYAHSFLYYGVVEATNRFYALLAYDKSSAERLDGIHNPCLPRGASMDVTTNIFMDTKKQETLYQNGTGGEYQLRLKNNNNNNNNKEGDFEACMSATEELLHREQNKWCDFAHQGDCSFNGVYQPALPDTEFLAFSNFYDVWNFLNLPQRSSLSDLFKATQYACSMSHDELIDFIDGRLNDYNDDDVNEYCFQSVYVFQLLHNGYGFKMEDNITATNVIDGHKVGWALGSMLYEINTMPWEYVRETAVTIPSEDSLQHHHHMEPYFLLVVVIGVLVSFFTVKVIRRRRHQREMYVVIKDIAHHY